jgi:predicted MFS family arabinose efflux permease
VQAPRRSEFSLGWKVLVASLLGVACGASPVPFNSIGFFLTPLNAEFGWSFFQISLGVTIFGVLGAFLAPVFGALADRHGVRPVALLSLAAFGVIFGAFALIPGSLSAYYGMWVLVGLVGIGSTPVTWTRGVNLWFFRNRGLALGCVLLGTSLAVIVVSRLSVFGLESFGWRLTFPLLANLPLLVALPVAWFWFREPSAAERPPEISGAGGKLTGYGVAECVRGYRFWLIFVSVLMVAFAYGGLHFHMREILKLQGFSASDAADVLAILGISIAVGRIGTGFLLDRIWAPLVTLPLLSLPAIACFFLAGDGLSMSLAMVAAVILGLAAGAETDLIAYLAGRYFGMANYGRIYGLLYAPFGLASAISPAIYGSVRDRSGSYDAILYVAAGLFVVGAVLLLGLGRYPNFAPHTERKYQA